MVIEFSARSRLTGLLLAVVHCSWFQVWGLALGALGFMGGFNSKEIHYTSGPSLLGFQVSGYE